VETNFPHDIAYRQYNETGFRLLPQVRLATKNKDESGATLQIQDALQHCGCIACGLQMDKYRPRVTPSSNKELNPPQRWAASVRGPPISTQLWPYKHNSSHGCATPIAFMDLPPHCLPLCLPHYCTVPSHTHLAYFIVIPSRVFLRVFSLDFPLLG
jgi:hypothetical protein